MRIVLPFFVLIVSFIYGLPNIILLSKLGRDYTPFTLKGSPIARDEAFAYAPEVNFVLANKSFLKEVYVEEYSESPTPFLGESAPAALIAFLTIFAGSLEGAFIAADFIFPPIIFLGLYYISKIYIKNNWLAIASAFVAVTARDFIAVIPFPSEIIKYLTVAENQNYLLYFSRAFHPQASFIFLLLPLVMVFRMINTPKNKINIVFLGVFLGLTYYSYVFYWTLFLFFYFLLLISFFLKKQFEILRSLMLSGLIGLFISSFYLVNMIHFYNLPFIEDFVTKSSLHNLPLPITLIRYLLLSFILFLSFKKKDLNSQVVVIFLMAGILITPLSKFIIGQDLETFHYLRRAVMPIATISLFIIFYNYFLRYKLLIRTAAILSIVAFLAFSLRTQVIATEKIIGSHVRNTDLEQVFEWLKVNTPTNSVVGSIDPDFSSLIEVYTKNRVFVPPTDRTITPTYELVERYKILSELLGLDNKWQKENLASQASYFFVYQAYDQNRKLDINSLRVQNAQQQIDDLSIDGQWRLKIANYKLDYIVVMPQDIAIVKPRLIYLNFLTSINQYLIFKYK